MSYFISWILEGKVKLTFQSDFLFYNVSEIKIDTFYDITLIVPKKSLFLYNSILYIQGVSKICGY